MIQTYRKELLRIIPILDPKLAASIEVHMLKPEALRFLLEFRRLMKLNVTFDVANEEIFGCNRQISMNGFPVTMELLMFRNMLVRFSEIHLARFARFPSCGQCCNCLDVPQRIKP